MSAQTPWQHIAVLGGGPAGVATAIGLRRLGYRVTLLAAPRRFAAMEGVSERVVEGLRHAGLLRAVQCLAAPSPRRAQWQGVENSQNHERLVSRPAFDAALLEDARAAGVIVCAAHVDYWRRVDNTAHVHYQPLADGGSSPQGDGASAGIETLTADFIVEARGRSAPQGAGRVRGPETVSLLQHWQPAQQEAEPTRPHSAVQSFDDGWAWLAQGSDGRRYLQLTLDVATAQLPPKAELADYCAARLATLALARDFMAGAAPQGVPHARASTAILAAEVAGPGWLRVGDAAMAVDPLSGNGIFQALSSALQAPAVIHTVLQAPERAALAQGFHQQRIEQLFYRFARIGRDFYASETQWAQRPFWQQRGGWPDAEPLHRAVTPDSVQVARRPVLHNGFIVEAEVVVTPDQPQGVWHVGGVAVAPALQAVRAAARGNEVAALSALVGVRAVPLLAWMRAQGWVAETVEEGR